MLATEGYGKKCAPRMGTDETRMTESAKRVRERVGSEDKGGMIKASLNSESFALERSTRSIAQRLGELVLPSPRSGEKGRV